MGIMTRALAPNTEGGAAGGGGGGTGAGGASGSATGGGAGGSGGASGGGGGGNDRADWVPPGRLREEAEGRRKAEAERDAARTEAASAWKAAGYTEDDLAVARTLHGRLPEKDRPALGDWLGGFKTDPTKAPKPLSHLFASQAAAGGTGTGTGTVGPGTQQQAAGGQAHGNTGTGGTGGLEGKALDEIIEQAKRTGDWTEYDKHRAGVLAKLARR